MDPITTIWTAIIASLSVEGIKWLVGLLRLKYGKINIPADVDTNAIEATESQGMSTLSKQEQAELFVGLLWAQRDYLLEEGFTLEQIYDMMADMLLNPTKYINTATSTPTALEQMTAMLRFLKSLEFRDDDEPLI